MKIFTLTINTLFFAILFFSQQSEAQPTEGQIRGVITYFFNNNFGDKPDIGARVFVIDSVQAHTFFRVNTMGDTMRLPSDPKAVMDTLRLGGSIRTTYLTYKSIESKRNPIPGHIIEEVKKWRVLDDAYFKALDTRAFLICMNIENAKNVKKTVVDGSGNFVVRVTPGAYYVLIESNNRKGISTMTEVSGKRYFTKVTVATGEDLNVSTNFGL